MYTLSDIDWMAAAHRREIYQATGARWSMEGVTCRSPQDAEDRPDKLKTLINSLSPADNANSTTSSKFEDK